MSSFLEGDAEARQERFVEALETQLAALREHHVDADFLKRNCGECTIYITLAPESGQAGILITPELVEEVSNIGATIAIDAFR
ncbi:MULTISPECIES: hypothetical protein [unclassified Leifsonia]|uniref:hypothetical protein n=1 Tax=unclassified Leifsonia TaxID=2663824 RepID=UPI001113A815|nr:MULTISPECIES: hypothetical protein [unclassified Leifsonia]